MNRKQWWTIRCNLEIKEKSKRLRKSAFFTKARRSFFNWLRFDKLTKIPTTAQLLWYRRLKWAFREFYLILFAIIGTKIFISKFTFNWLVALCCNSEENRIMQRLLQPIKNSSTIVLWVPISHKFSLVFYLILAETCESVKKPSWRNIL